MTTALPLQVVLTDVLWFAIKLREHDAITERGSWRCSDN
ncbi:hypothetical protein MUK42_31250 [Musa troglodytarum]|uniref:Uncharacterized protein n=1 Tax=Musa troglodytarum TaxID=320322 RepID=A0A9E7K157_9LILI|nr:hypothetical protein MUK42_31250 [Musa troglodytarum]